MLKVFGTAVALCLTFQYATAATNKVVCYYQSKDTYTPEDINVNICTHINYAFLTINDDGSLKLEEGGDSILKRLGALKNRNKNLKLLISIGGEDQHSQAFSRVAANAGAKNSMANGILYYMKTYKFDGVDVDWEYPAQNGKNAADKENFIDMLRTIKNLQNKNGGGLVTVAVSSSADGGSYNVPEISKVVDFINVMTYNFNDPKKATENSPLYASSSDSQWEKENSNCDASIRQWLKSGANPEKVLLGLAFFGVSFKLADPNKNGIGAPAVMGEEKSYTEICKLKEGWQQKRDSQQQVPYKYQGNLWIGYDDPESIANKVKYAKSKNLGGVMIWSAEQDDKNGACGKKNALLQAVKDNL